MSLSSRSKIPYGQRSCVAPCRASFLPLPVVVVLRFSVQTARQRSHVRYSTSGYQGTVSWLIVADPQHGHCGPTCGDTLRRLSSGVAIVIRVHKSKGKSWAITKATKRVRHRTCRRVIALEGWRGGVRRTARQTETLTVSSESRASSPRRLSVESHANGATRSSPTR